MLELNQMSVLHVIPVTRVSVQNRHSQKSNSVDSRGNIVTNILRKNKVVVAQGRSASDKLSFSKREGGRFFDAGLNEMIANPFYTTEKVDQHRSKLFELYNLSDEWLTILPSLIEQKEISKQRLFEIKFGLAPDDLTERVPRRGSDGLIDPKDHTILSKFRFTFYDETNILKDKELKGAIAIQLAKKHRLIAPSKKEMNTAVHLYYIDEKEVVKNLRTQKRNHTVLKASSKLFELIETYPQASNLGDNVIYKISSLCKYKSGKPVVKGKLTPIAIDREINTFIQKNVSDQLRNVEKFLDTVNTFETNPKLFNCKFLVQQALNCNLIYTSNGYVVWSSQKLKPEWYKHDSLDIFTNFILDQMEKFDPLEKNAHNAFDILNKEVASKPLGVALNIG